MNRRSTVVAVGLMTALVGCGMAPGAGPTAKPTAASTASGAGPIAYATSWDENGVPKGSVEVRKPSDLSKLVGAPSDFVDFVGRELAEAERQDAAYPECDPPGITVDGIDSAIGVATGSEWGCGEGAEALWIRWNGRWLHASGTQMGWPCEELHKFMVPTAITAPTCDIYTGSTPNRVHYKGPAPLPTATGTPGRRVVYMSTLDANSHGADGARINVEDDPAYVLKDPPSAFVDLIDGLRDQGCGVMVDGIDPSVGIATGSVIDCADARASIWIRWHNRWMEAASVVGRWSCYELKNFRVPADLTGSTCSEWDDKGKEAVIGYERPAA